MFDGLFLCQKSYFQVRNVSIVALHDVNEGVEQLIWAFSRKNKLRKNASKEGSFFGCEGKIALFSFPSL